MPRPPIDLEQFRNEIEQRLIQHHTQGQIRTWLANRGVQVSKNTLSARILAWVADADDDPDLTVLGPYRRRNNVSLRSAFPPLPCSLYCTASLLACLYPSILPMTLSHGFEEEGVNVGALVEGVTGRD